MHANYESTDFENIFNRSAKGMHDYICDLHAIPKPEEFYNVIICTQVLEHVQYPQEVINEFFRILKPDGKLFLTAPQGYGVHGEPYHFFNFTKYGLESLFKNAGFEILFIKPRGGIFWFLSKTIKILPTYIRKQLFHLNLNSHILIKFMTIVAFAPFSFICGFFIPLLFFYLDKLDHKQSWTLGYTCFCIKNRNISQELPLKIE